jgi:hypothetical protein
VYSNWQAFTLSSWREMSCIWIVKQCKENFWKFDLRFFVPCKVILKKYISIKVDIRNTGTEYLDHVRVSSSAYKISSCMRIISTVLFTIVGTNCIKARGNLFLCKHVTYLIIRHKQSSLSNIFFVILEYNVCPNSNLYFAATSLRSGV